ncbi:MAG: hypothetical protein ACFFAS_18835 [Promethearchaeota archaeon]
MPDNPTIGLDYSHNNNLTLEAPSYAEFTEFLFSSGYKLGKIQAGFDSISKLETYDAILFSTPKNTLLSENEINVLEEYVKKGGNLLIVSSSGGDAINETNLNELTSKFGFEFLPNEVNDSMNYVNLQKRPILSKIKPHILTEQVRQIVYSSACSLKVLDFIDVEDEIKIDVILTGGLNCWTRVYDGSDWKEQDSPNLPLMVAVEYYKGKVVGFGNLSMFSSLGHEYGITALDNNILIANILRWLTIGAYSEGKVVTVNLMLELFYWINAILKEDNWDNISDIINLSLKYFKDNYSNIVENIKKTREIKLKQKKAYEKAKAKESGSIENKIIEMVPDTRRREDLEDIMSAIGDITGEKYEIEIDLEKKDEAEVSEDFKVGPVETEEETLSKEDLKKIEKELEKKSKAASSLEYTEEDIKEFEKTGKNAIWRGKTTKAFKLWLKVKRA